MTRHEPPAWMMRFFRWYCREDLADGVEGDLLEMYDRNRQALSRKKANWLYLWHVLTFFQPFAFKRKSRPYRLNNHTDMIRNYFLIATRTLKLNKVFTTINVLGLALGISAFILMISFVLGEISYDQFHTDKDRILRLTYSYVARGSETKVSRVPFPLKQRLLDSYPEVESVVRFYQNRMDLTTLRNGERTYTEEGIYFVDPEVFEVFDFKLEQGDETTALKETNSIVLTRKVAAKYFGDENPMGKILEFKEGNNLLTVTGILEDVPVNSHIQFDMLVPTELQRTRWKGAGVNNGYDLEEDWRWSGSWMYVKLKHNSAVGAFEHRLLADGKDFFGRVKNKPISYQFRPQALTDIYFDKGLVSEIGLTGNRTQVYAFLVIAIAILIVAGINFVNLSTARAAKRAKEVGLRKVMGAFRPQLIGQFLAESILITGIATLIALVLIQLILPFFNHFVGTEVVLPYVEQPAYLIFFVFEILVIGVLAGIYPAFYLSRFQPGRTLKGNYESGQSRRFGLRKALVVTQFIVSNVLIIGILVIDNQLDFIKNKDLGFDKEQMVVLKHGNKLDSAYQLFVDRIVQHSSVATVNKGYVAGHNGWVQSFRVNGESLNESKSMGHKRVSYGFVDMYDLEVVSGRNFSREFKTDSSSAILLNESAVKSFGWTNEEALGQRFSYIGGNDNRTRYDLKVIGVLKDANFESLYEPVEPSVFQLYARGDITIKLNAQTYDRTYEALSHIESVWNDINPQWPFEYEFLDQHLADQYKKDALLGDMIKYFGILAIIVACLGLFGLAAYTVQRRTKEIGIRKVMGATVSSVLIMISRGFFLLIVLSYAISIPLGYLLADRWLDGFTFHITMGPLIFVWAGVIALLIAFFAISFQCLRAAMLNPVETLKYE